MKRHLACVVIVLLIGGVSWSQGTKEPFDVKKSSEELEIMKGILNTTLKFVVKNSENQNTHWRFLNTSNINSFYLAGQGAVFVIPTSGLHISGIPSYAYNFDLGPDFSQQMEALGRDVSNYARDATQQALSQAYEQQRRSGQGTDTAPAPPVPAAPPAPPAPPAPQIDREKLRKSVEDAQARVKKMREEAEANREKFLKSLAEVKIYLVEALANYGDSLTTVKPEEFINLVLVSDGLEDQRSRSDVISARKSWITDYKAGRLNMEGFKQKVVQYNQ